MIEEEENDIELIERYLNGSLSASELQSFKDRMAIDPSFSQKVEDFKDIIIGIRSHSESKFSDEVAEWEEELKNEKAGIQFNWKIAAVVLLVIGAGAAIVLMNGESPEDLFAKNFTPYEDVITVRGSESVMGAYNNKNYEEASRQMEMYLLAAPDNLNVRFYYAISLIASGKEEKGIESLNKVIEGNGMLKEQAEWYRALGFLKLKNVDAAKEQLQNIKPGHDYYEKAYQLLQQLPR